VPAANDGGGGTAPDRRETAWTAAVLVLAFAVFWASPHRAIGDYQYSTLLSQSLLEHRGFALER
jgi:hypothetical protein